MIRLLLCLMLTGCAAPQVYTLERKTVTVVEVKGLPTLEGRTAKPATKPTDKPSPPCAGFFMPGEKHDPI